MTAITKFGPQAPVSPGNPPRYYECGICDHIHPWDFDGDCRDDNNRLTYDDLDERHTSFGYELLTMDDRVAADEESWT